MTPLRLILAAPLLFAAGCVSHGGTLTRAPDDWAGYADKTVTVQGTAGNSQRGPIVRLTDGGYIALAQREPWGFVSGFAIASRSVEVTGKVVSGQGIRDEPFVLDTKQVRLLGPDEIKRAPTPSAELR